MNTGYLHAVTEEEVEAAALRAQALQRFSARYRHNPASQRTMLSALRRVARVFSDGVCDEHSFPWEMLVDDDLVDSVWQKVATDYARRTALKDASAVRVMLDCCRRVGLLTYEEYRSATSFDTTRGGHERHPAGTYLTEGDVAAILRTCRTGPGHPQTRLRDLCLILVMASSGTRGDEVTGIDLEDVDLPQRRIWLKRAKGGKQRYAWLHPSAVDALEMWLQIRGSRPGALFVPLSRTGRPLLHRRARTGRGASRLSTFQTWKIVRQRAALAGFDGITPHDLRRFVISTLLKTHDLAKVAKVVGHTNPETTASYDRRPLQEQRDAVATLDLPKLAEWDLQCGHPSSQRPAP